MINKKNLLAAAVMAAFSISAYAADKQTEYSYATPGSDEYIWGTTKAETYDVAILLKDPTLVGKRVVGVQAPVGSDQDVTNISAFMTKTLGISGKNNAADIAVKAGEWSTETTPAGFPIITATFDEPYTITEEGVYVGYSFTVTSAVFDGQKNPIIVTPSDRTDGLYLHTTRTYLKWGDYSAKLEAVSMMKVIIEGEFPENTAAISEIKPVYMERGKDGIIGVSISNAGVTPINKVDYTYNVAETNCVYTGSCTLTEPVQGVLGAKGFFECPLELDAEVGTYTLNFAITAINGVPSEATAQGRVVVMPFVPVTRPLMEEYTGLWCGYCPRGFIAMERLNHDLGDQFVGVAYHDGNGGYEPMQLLAKFPGQVAGFPAAILNRAYSVDPYYGNTQEDMGIRVLWSELASQSVPAEVAVDVEWVDATHLKATSSVRFVEDIENADYRLGFILTGDNITGEQWAGTNEEWKQSNYFNTSQFSFLQGDDWKVFTKGASKVAGLVYNDVALKYDDQKGIAGSVPANLKAGEYAKYEYTFDISTVRNAKGYDIINDKNSLRVVAVLTRGAAAEFVNCAKSKKSEGAPNAVLGIDDDTEVISTQWFDLQGRSLNAPATGVNVRVDVLSNGKRIATKVAR